MLLREQPGSVPRIRGSARRLRQIGARPPRSRAGVETGESNGGDWPKPRCAVRVQDDDERGPLGMVPPDERLNRGRTELDPRDSHGAASAAETSVGAGARPGPAAPCQLQAGPRCTRARARPAHATRGWWRRGGSSDRKLGRRCEAARALAAGTGLSTSASRPEIFTTPGQQTCGCGGEDPKVARSAVGSAVGDLGLGETRAG